MTRIAYFQPFNGCSGDMTLGSLVDAGLCLDELRKGLLGLDLDGYSIEEEKVLRGAFQCTRVRVVVDGRDQVAEKAPGHQHSHEHNHEHSHSHSHSHSHPGSTPESRDADHRSLGAITSLIEASSLPQAVVKNAKAVFTRLGEVEAGVHGVDIEDVHFHEVGAVDSIVDIVGSCLALELLGIEEVYCAPITVGTGFVEGAHGRMPLPAPATANLLRGFPIRQVDSGAELTTPTGAALMTTLAKDFGTMPPLQVTATGFGAGDERQGTTPNALRVFLGEREEAAAGRDRVLLLETNIDDMSSEWIGHLMDRLLEEGALDVSVSPILMKKSRPAHKLTILAPLEREQEITHTLFCESTTIGVRRTETERVVLERETEEIEAPWGKIRIKIARHGGEQVGASPEFEDLKRAAASSGLPLKELHRLALEIFHRGTEADTGEQS